MKTDAVSNACKNSCCPFWKKQWPVEKIVTAEVKNSADKVIRYSATLNKFQIKKSGVG
jgi:hypothetical protein